MNILTADKIYIALTDAYQTDLLIRDVWFSLSDLINVTSVPEE
jgi:hypothetical protein